MEKNNDFRQSLEQLSSQQLAEMIQAETAKETPDDDLVLQILRILEEREKDDPVELEGSARAAWEKYRAKKTKRHGSAHFGWCVKAASIVAIVCILIPMIPQTAMAGSVWKILASYTDAIFEYFNIGQSAEAPKEYGFETDNPGLQQLYDTVAAELSITEPVVAQWLPEEYELAEITRIDTPSEDGICAKFVSGEKEAVFIFSEMKIDFSPKYDKSDAAIKELEVNGICHNYMRNNDVWLASWVRQNLKCAIRIDCQEEDLINIIKSIYE